jgi:hypothetical protein
VLCAGSTLLLAPTLCTRLLPRQLGTVNLFSSAVAKVSEQQSSELVSFSYWSIKLWFHTKGKLTIVLIIPSSWGFPTGPVRHQVCILAEAKEAPPLGPVQVVRVVPL